MAIKAPIIMAIDTSDIEIARQWIECVGDSITAYKLGLEFFITHGAEGIHKLRQASDADLFLDLKLHDIPNTVAAAARGAALVGPRFLTVHASGGSSMVASAVREAGEVDITAVTILTSLDSDDLLEIGFAKSPLESAVTLAQLAQGAGARAIVCSPLEITAIRQVVGPDLAIITPGVRPAGEENAGDDQARTMTPEGAIKLGANYVVIGRPITKFWREGADQMRDRAARLAEEVSRGS